MKINKNQFRNILKEEIRNILREDYATKLYKIEGLLITDTYKKTQTQILSDIRSITGITTIDSKEYRVNLPKPGYQYDVLTVKIDPYPYTKNGGKFDIDTINQIINNIKSIRGVIRFKVDNPQLINIGI
jgi:hypothetical protein